jgi:hypothetical protein
VDKRDGFCRELIDAAMHITQGFLIAALLQLIIEVLVYQTLECLWVHYAIPRLVSNDVKYSLSELRRSVGTAFSRKRDASGVLDSPEHLFVSTKVAKIFPTLFESSIVLAYHTVYPGRVAEKWKGKPKTYAILGGEQATGVGTDKVWVTRINDCCLRIYRFLKRMTLMATVLTVMQYLGTFPMRLQKGVIHTVQPLLLVIVFLMFYFMFSVPAIGISVLCAAVLYGAYCVWRRRYRAKKGTGTVAPVLDNELEEDGEDVHKGGRDSDAATGRKSHKVLVESVNVPMSRDEKERYRAMQQLQAAMESSSVSNSDEEEAAEVDNDQEEEEEEAKGLEGMCDPSRGDDQHEDEDVEEEEEEEEELRVSPSGVDDEIKAQAAGGAASPAIPVMVSAGETTALAWTQQEEEVDVDELFMNQLFEAGMDDLLSTALRAPSLCVDPQATHPCVECDDSPAPTAEDMEEPRWGEREVGSFREVMGGEDEEDEEYVSQLFDLYLRNDDSD